MYNRINFDERYVAQCNNPIIGQTFGRPAQKYTGRFRVIAPRAHLKMPQKSVTHTMAFAPRQRQKFDQIL